MKIVYSWILFGVMAAGLTGGSAPLRAQPANDSAVTSDERAPGDDDSVPSEDAPASSEDAPASSEDTPAPSEDTPALSGGQPASRGNSTVTPSGATISIYAPDKLWSQGVSIEDREAARALFLEGNRQFRIPLFARAAEKYVAALSKWKHPSIYLNLAIAQLNAGQEVEARDSLERALQYGQDPLGPENFRGAQLQLEEVKRQLGQIRVSCQTPGAQVTLDGVLLFTGPGSYEGWVKAEDHEITAKKPKYLSEARRVTVVPGQSVKISLKLLTLSEAADASRRWAVWKPWATLAAGGAFVATAGVFHALAYRNFKDHDREFRSLGCAQMDPIGCPVDDPELPRLTELNDQLILATRERAVAIGAYVVGGSLVGVSMVLLYLNRPRLSERIGDSSSRSMVISPMIRSEMLGILAKGTY